MQHLAAVLDAELQRAGYHVRKRFDLTTAKLAFCQGEFDCWVKTPGVCRVLDLEREIVAEAHDADALVTIGPLVFGGHGHAIKLAIDRMLCLLEPFFVKRASLTHHSLRYATHARLFSVAWSERTPPDEAITFGDLNDANAINYLAPERGSVALDESGRESWGDSIREMLVHPRVPGADVGGRDDLRRALITASTPEAFTATGHARKLARLVGSAKPKGTSASEVLARAVEKRLAAAQVETELHFATEFVHDDARSLARAEAIAACDAFMLVTPLYADSLPALATHALELIARVRATTAETARFYMLVNCGFPEAEQNRTAMRIARHFSARARYAWAGGLPFGAGGMVMPDTDLDAPHGPTAGVVRALDLAAKAIAEGGALPAAAIESIAKPAMPEVLYRIAGDVGWRWQAYQNGLAQRELHEHPLDAHEE